MLLLDLFCGPGGAAMGYHRAGFAVLGVDIVRQPRYPFPVVQAEALSVLDGLVLAGRLKVDAIHASPPCKAFSLAGPRVQPDLLTPTLKALAPLEIPWVVENVPEAPLRADLELCGCRFGLPVRRRRIFQFGGWNPGDLATIPCVCGDVQPFIHKDERAFADAMGVPWADKWSARQAIPPAYTELIGRSLAQCVRT